MRINKFIANNSQYSRRHADKLILSGKILLNGKPHFELGSEIDPEKDTIEIVGTNTKISATQTKKVYIAFNKPQNIVTTREDELNRPTIMKILPPEFKNLKPAGRLDRDTEGLILLSNDGEFIYKQTHPKFNVVKEYNGIIKGALTPAEKRKLESGIIIDGKKTAPAKITITQKNNQKTFLKIEIHEGRKRQIRKMFDSVGHPVEYLQRIRIGCITLGDLEVGHFRYLTPREINGNQSY